MDHSSSNTNGTVMTMMTPFLHMNGGDFLFFKAWQPTPGGAIAGACVGLFLFAIFERWINALSGVLEARWKQRALQTKSSTQPLLEKTPRHSAIPSSETSSVKKEKSLPPRTIPPFITTIDVPRGMMYGFHRLLGFILMLAVMTFHAGYIVSILVGLALGEIIFGRINIGVHTSNRTCQRTPATH